MAMILGKVSREVGRRGGARGGITCVKCVELYGCIKATRVTEKTYFPLLCPMYHQGKIYNRVNQMKETQY